MTIPVSNLFPGFIIFSVFIFISYHKEQVIDSYKSPHYFYSEDNTKILFDTGVGIKSVAVGNYKEVTTDVSNFVVLSKLIGKNSQNIYYAYKPLTNVDPHTYERVEEDILMFGLDIVEIT